MVEVDLVVLRSRLKSSLGILQFLLASSALLLESMAEQQTWWSGQMPIGLEAPGVPAGVPGQPDPLKTSMPPLLSLKATPPPGLAVYSTATAAAPPRLPAGLPAFDKETISTASFFFWRLR